jgi:predicted metal-binding membrane protein
MKAIEAILRHDRWIVIAALAAITGLAWSYVWDGAGMGMSALDMTAATLFPHLQAHVGGSMPASWGVVVLMWWVMMIAMMTPSAAPLVLLHGRVLRHHGRPSAGAAFLLLAGYLFAWLLFSLAAAAVQKALAPAGLLSGMMLWSRSALLSALVLAAAGAYQLSPAKRACLTQCRTPARFLMEHWRPGALGAFVLGARHGLFCVGCCWLLMALLFVGGIMNLLWIAALMLFVLVERITPAGEHVGRAFGVVLLAWAAATLLV